MGSVEIPSNESRTPWRNLMYLFETYLRYQVRVILRM